MANIKPKIDNYNSLYFKKKKKATPQDKLWRQSVREAIENRRLKTEAE